MLLDRDETVVGKFGGVPTFGIPALFLIDRDGNLRAQYRGYSHGLDIKEELKKIGVQ